MDNGEIKRTEDSTSEEDDIMNANTAVNMNNILFNDFLKKNKEKINAFVPKNPSISKDDEWRNEDFWDNKDEESKR